MNCKICNTQDDHDIYEVQEMMFGYQDKFIYFQCRKCGCLQISEFPIEMSKYYPHDYLSFVHPASNFLFELFKKVFEGRRNNFAFSNRGFLGKIIYQHFPQDALRSLAHIPISKDMRILDVGSGIGKLLLKLNAVGFNQLLGIDPCLKNDYIYKNGLRILKKTIYEIEGTWDLIMFHHSFEHVSDPVETLKAAAGLLSRGGHCLIRVPTVSSYAWEHYRENWVQLDAPRHFFLHSLKSIEILAYNAGFKLNEIIYDSNEFQFWGSEQYLKNVPLNSDNSYWRNPRKSMYSKSDIKIFHQKALELNLSKQGDQICIYLTKG
ncbi:MAG: class I SAM-dependent methyltransferase [Candidatus Omnitrophica bacterium]|nr:class I SAM-dependent methyltransferase [Candidatus Omnitrophota bacterium]